MKKSFDSIKPQPLTQIDFRSIPFHLEYNQKPEYKRAILTEQLENKDLDIIKRIAAAMSLSSLNRVEQKHPIDMACIDFGHGKVVLFPGETFVGYQLMAQQLLPDNFVFSIGFGESWPGYIPMNVIMQTDSMGTAGPGYQKKQPINYLQRLRRLSG